MVTFVRERKHDGYFESAFADRVAPLEGLVDL
jgi:hypothetical protein